MVDLKTINVGVLPDDDTGEAERDAFIKANAAITGLNAHRNDTGNPHRTTAGQVGAYTKAEVDSAIQTFLTQVQAGSISPAQLATALAGVTIANSTTAISLVTGAARTIFLTAAGSSSFRVGAFASLSRTSDPNTFAVIAPSAYNPTTGQLDFTIQAFSGAAGPFMDWQVAGLAASTLLSLALTTQGQAAATAAQGYAGSAAADRGLAQTARTDAQTAAGQAQTARDQAQAAAQAANGIQPSGSFSVGRLLAAGNTTGTVVTDSGFTGKEALSQVQTVPGASKSYAASDLYGETRRSNSGSAMTDTLPASNVAGLVNGTRLRIHNAETIGSGVAHAVAPGSGTTLQFQGASVASVNIDPGRTAEFIYDGTATAWRATGNSLSALLAGNALAEIAARGTAAQATARTNIGLVKATTAQAQAGTDDATYTTPAGVKAGISAIALLSSNALSEIATAGAAAQASARSNIGMVKASTAQAQAGTDDATYTTPAGVAAAIKALAISGPAGARAISVADTIVAADRGKVLNLTGTFTLGATAAATLGAGFLCYLRKRDGSGVVIFDPNAAETIDARTAINVYQESFLIWTDGTSWFSQERPKGWIPVMTVALTGQSLASLSITDGFLDPEIGEIEFKFENLNFASSTTTAYRPIKNGAIQTNTNVVVEAINTATTTASGTSTNSATGGVGLTLTASTGPVSGQIKARNTLSAVAADTRVEIDAMQVGATRRGWTYESTAAQLGGFALVPGANITSISYTVKGYRP